MEKKNQVIHLYEFDQQSINHKELTQRILEALRPYIGEKVPEIKIRGRPHKYWAYFEAEPQISQKLNQLKTIQIADQTLNIGTYYYDYQIFIKSIDAKTPEKKIQEYFSQFGQIEHMVMTEPFSKNSGSYRRCYIKMKDDKVVDSIILGQIHLIEKCEVKCVRTFGLDEDKESDKKLCLIIQGDINQVQDLEQKAIEYFMKFGKIRERPRIESTNNNKNKMVIIFSSYKDANNALENFPSSPLFNESKQKGLEMKLSYFYTKQNKIYAVGLKDVNEKNVQEVFKYFGEISEVKVSKLKNGVVTAVVGFINEQSYKMALASYMEVDSLRKIFNGKPSVTIYMSPDERKSFNEMKKKQARNNMRSNNMPPGINPQYVQFPGNMTPQIPPNMPPNMVPQQYGPPPGFKGYGQPPSMGGPPPPPRMPQPPQGMQKNQ